MNLAVLLALLALSQVDGGRAAPPGGTAAGATADAGGGTPDGGTPDGGAAPDPARAEAGDAPDGGDADDEIVRHLDEIEKLELLRNLELFDTAPDADRKR